MRLKYFLTLLLAVSFIAFAQEEQKKILQIEKAEIFKEIYPLIQDNDLYCSFYITKKPRFEIKIIGSETMKEKIQMSDRDIFYINRGSKDGIKVGDKFTILEVGRTITHPRKWKIFGKVVFKRGIAKVTCVEEEKACVEVLKSCSAVRVKNSYLVPFEEKEGLMGKNLGYNICDLKEKELKGTIIYIQNDFVEAGKNHWVSIDLGREDGIFIGLQMTIYRYLKKNLPRKVIGNLIIVDTQAKTSTGKILSCRDAVYVGDEVEPIIPLKKK
ncbi:hypothetical protein NLC26_01280 [Candidatus Aminicenantes bacterium AC-708-M15]|jgi:hypothetical protein|nr:hypothetical protein [SCandidatus Aminicenantes bacterium Aminicenantia_JdfR_composite]MCP2596379.1 hypothetical protein [Candidatus Aminicenantes bacterium AC-335-G13]MCP2598564.1 hypothetical protein [Candidatus Aminicenantes bacterium AC-335-L06]MCP2604092.1 hypothetical protein [Candidatus Aminicenantes bacterium AC-708-M15]MCP2605381.1 hypothetical protein [Candidatus Aminicenantes bacterium AC-335-O07]MCP2606008.1 hypothetical protein [Candidatus Aminicenantes bacterium AC-708-I09]MC